MGTPYRLRSRFRQTEVPDLALLDQVLDCSRNLFDRNVRIDTVLVEKVDGVDAQPLERGLGDLPDVFGPTVEPSAALPAGIDLEPELGGDHHLVTNGRERLAHQLLVRERTIDLGGVEERHAEIDGRADHADHVLLVASRAVAEAHAHAAQADGGDLQVAVAQLALLHVCLRSLADDVRTAKPTSREPTPTKVRGRDARPRVSNVISLRQGRTSAAHRMSSDTGCLRRALPTRVEWPSACSVIQKTARLTES